MLGEEEISDCAYRIDQESRGDGGREGEDGDSYAEADGLHVLHVPLASMRRQQRSQKRAGATLAGRAAFLRGAAAAAGRGLRCTDDAGGKLSSVARCCSA